MGIDPQPLNADGTVPRGKACLGLSSEVATDGVTGLVVGLASRGDDGMFPAGDPDDLMLAVAWGEGPDGADVGPLMESGREFPWVPAASLIRTTTYIPDGA